MSATRSERASTLEIRGEYDRRAAAAGHTLEWRLGENATRKGCAYFWVGECTQCGATLSVYSDSTTCSGVRDARKVACSGPGTTVLTAIEAARSRELFAAAIRQFGEDVRVALGGQLGEG